MIAAIMGVLTISLFIAGGGLGTTCVGLIQRRRDKGFRFRQALAQTVVVLGVVALLLWRQGPTGTSLVASGFAIIGIPLAGIDLRTRTLPNWLMLPCYLTVAGLVLIAARAEHNPGAFLGAAGGAAILLALYGTLYLIAPGQVGGGDLKMTVPVGLLAGWCGWNTLLISTLLAWLLAAIVLTGWKAIARSTTTVAIAFGPFMVTGTLIAVLLSSRGGAGVSPTWT